MRSLSNKDTALCAVYGLIAVVALIATWWHNLAFLRQEDNSLIAGFIQGGYANHAAASLTNDVLMVSVAAIIWMLVEARRVGIRHAWIFPIFAFSVAISVAFPIFLIARQVVMARAASADAPGHLMLS